MLKIKTRRILDMHLLLLDQLTEGSLRRKLEMAVDTVVTFQPAYTVQFWKDVRLYGIDEAKTYLQRFIPDDLADAMVNDLNAVSEVIDEIHTKFEEQRAAILKQTGGR